MLLKKIEKRRGKERKEDQDHDELRSEASRYSEFVLDCRSKEKNSKSQ